MLGPDSNAGFSFADVGPRRARPGPADYQRGMLPRRVIEGPIEFAFDRCTMLGLDNVRRFMRIFSDRQTTGRAQGAKDQGLRNATVAAGVR